ncbi:MAG: S1 RNA-binding domain-containing protein [Bryobacterales bacterium]|nr:S1 RNA-binding domain-containing protein [Bryobacterales bacterium]
MDNLYTPESSPASASVAAEDEPTNAQTNEPSFGDILTQFEQEHKGDAPGVQAQTIDGVVVSVTDDGVFVDIGRKREGVLPPEQARNLKPGDHVRVTIAGRTDSGATRLSIYKVFVPTDFTSFEEAFANKAVVSGTVTEQVKGGFRVDIGIPAFMPASRSGAREQADMDKLVGQQIECRITKLEIDRDGDQADAVVDRRGVLEERAAAVREQAFGSLKEGAVVEGTVRSLTEFGAFVDLGGVDGLLHVAEMSYVRNAKPQDIVRPGDRIQVKILKINAQTRKISLGMKQLMPDPFAMAVESLAQGQRIKGKVSRTTDFGAFVEIQPGVEGLIHVSEMSWSKKQKRPADIVKPGELVDVIVLGINAAEKRISLGLKQALGDPWDDAKKKYPIGAIVEAPITSLANFGAFVDLGDGIEGMIHVGDLVAGKRLQHPKEAVAVGQTVKAQVLELDQERRRVRLGMKQLEPTSADSYIAEHNLGDVVTGRVVELREDRAKVELGEGVTGYCRVPKPAAAEKKGVAERPATVDLGSLSAMLAAKWKQGGATSAASAGPEGLGPGQVRTFKISALDAGAKRIDLELPE